MVLIPTVGKPLSASFLAPGPGELERESQSSLLKERSSRNLRSARRSRMIHTDLGLRVEALPDRSLGTYIEAPILLSYTTGAKALSSARLDQPYQAQQHQDQRDHDQSSERHLYGAPGTPATRTPTGGPTMHGSATPRRRPPPREEVSHGSPLRDNLSQAYCSVPVGERIKLQ